MRRHGDSVAGAAIYRGADSSAGACTPHPILRITFLGLCNGGPVVESDTLARYGLVKEGRRGYSIGLSFPPDWGEAQP